MNGLTTIILLTASNIFMTFAWYGHLKFRELPKFAHLPLFMIILVSWMLAFFEYCFQVPANRFGYVENGGAFNLIELKVIQEIVNLTVFTFFTLFLFKTETIRLNHIIGFMLLIAAVYFIFKK